MIDLDDRIRSDQEQTLPLCLEQSGPAPVVINDYDLAFLIVRHGPLTAVS